MLFSSIPFLFYFLPAVLLCYFLVPFRGKNAVLLVFSLLFYSWGEPRYLLLMVISILLGYGFGLLLERRPTKLLLELSVAVFVLLLGYFKYADFVLSTLSLPLLRVALPIGISFYTFQLLSYLVDVYRGDTPAQRNILSFAAYVSLFPQLIAGPIVRYKTVAAELSSRRTTLQDAAEGAQRFLVGLGKKVLLANVLGELCTAYRVAAEPSVLFSWLYALSFTLQIYFDFSGYSDMAIGLGRIFGFHFSENFNYPFLSRSIAEFWRRWHISLGSWFRDYVYIPLGGNRVSFLRWTGNILVVWALTGLWHGAAWNFVLWGLYFAVLLLLEKWLRPRLPAVLSHVLVLLLLLFSFVLFSGDSLRQVGQDYAALLGLSGLPGWTTESLFYLRSYGIPLLLAAIGATPLPKVLAQRFSVRLPQPFFETLRACYLVGLLLLCTASLVDGSFNPFLYFRF